MVIRRGLARGLSKERHLLPSLTTQGIHREEERTDSHGLSSDLHMCAMALAPTNSPHIPNTHTHVCTYAHTCACNYTDTNTCI